MENIIRLYLIVERVSYFSTAIILTLFLFRVTNPEASFSGIVRISLFLCSISSILVIIFSSIFFDRFVSKFKKLLEIVSIDLENDAHTERLDDFKFIESKAKEAIERLQNQYFEECKSHGQLSKQAIKAGKRFSKNYNFLRKFGLVYEELGVYMKRNPYQPHLA